jgi:molybdate transport system substrate-binding protein
MGIRAFCLLILLSVLVVLVNNCSANSSTEPGMVSIFAAAGSKPSIDEVCQNFQERYGIKLQVSYGGGGEILNQMILARSGDVYIAPEQNFMRIAKQKRAIKPETMRTLAYMVPVIAVQKGNPKRIDALADMARPGIRVGTTRRETTLLGRYAPEIFQKSGFGEAIEKNIVTHAPHPHGLLTMLIMGQVDAGILWHFYGSLAPDKIETVFMSPEQLTGIGEMRIAVSAYSKKTKLAQQFVDFAASSEGKAIFKRHGYIVDTEEVKRYWK